VDGRQWQRHVLESAVLRRVLRIRVGSDYYLTGTTMHTMPGLPILHSKDLVNWRIIGYAFDRLDLGPDFRLEGGKDIYGQGIWAPSFRYHKGTMHMFALDALGSRTHDYLARPAREGEFPAVIQLQYAGVYALDARMAAQRAAEGWLILNVDSHDKLPSDPSGNIPRNYASVGNTDREKCTCATRGRSTTS
jgi:hypothetical protein